MFYCLFLPSASVIPEVHCLISPHQCPPPRGRVDLLIGSCDQTYGGTRHRPRLPGGVEKRPTCGFIAPPPSPFLSIPPPSPRSPSSEWLGGRLWPLDVARCKRMANWCQRTCQFFWPSFPPPPSLFVSAYLPKCVITDRGNCASVLCDLQNI